MKHIKLTDLTLKNFKGIRDANISFTDKTEIAGANATGKTTLVDASMWLLFDKDSQGSSTFLIRPKDETGKDIDHIEIEVTGTLDVEGETIALTKTQKQKWVKKRGAATQTFEGNVNEFQINGFPAKKSEYEAKIREIIDENLFQLLTNPRTFAAMKWQDQRKILLEFVSDITDASILDSDPDKYQYIRNDVMAAGADKAREKAQSILKALKKEQAEYPVRIDEANNSLTETATADDIANRRKAVEESIERIQAEREDLNASLKGTADIKGQIMQLNMHLMEIESNTTRDAANQRYALRRKADEELSKVRSLEDQILRTTRQINGLQADVDGNEQEIQRLRDQWKDIRSRKLPEDAEICPTCGQRFPAENLAEIAKSFQERKAKDLESTNQKGQALRADTDKMKGMVEELSQKRQGLEDKLAGAQKVHEEALNAAESFEAADFHSLPDYKDTLQKMQDLEKQLASMDNGETAKQVLSAKELEARDILAAINREESELDANERIRDRIRMLQSELQACSQKIADQEQIVYLLEEFSKTKMSILSEKINGHFKHVRFKLFETQINGGVKETCVMQINSNGSYVDYNSANNAARIVGGLDIIDALSGLYGVTAPIFVDNAEAINDVNIPEMKAQMILLKVSEDEKLVVRQ